jgi:NAD(P)-dependent dehydrogenase (short-subunit alcohol dehydrogenase family)
MARILITGSSDGLGQLAARRLIASGHIVVLHARSAARASQARAAVPAAETCLIGDLSSVSSTKQLAADANALGRFDAVIHNAGLGFQESTRDAPNDQPAKVFAVNSLAPYILTCLMTPPKRLVYISSGLHAAGIGSVDDLAWARRPWNGYQAYSDSKLQNILLANAVARRWKDVMSNAVSPGWVATKMGGASANDDLKKGSETQVWLATSEGAERETGGYWYHMERKTPSKVAESVALQDAYLKECERISGVKFPERN